MIYTPMIEIAAVASLPRNDHARYCESAESNHSHCESAVGGLASL